MTAFYAGSFDPFTIGHKSIADRALEMFDHLIIGIGYNEHKKGEWSVDQRLKAITAIYETDSRVKVISYIGLTALKAKELGAHILVRGVRNTLDFEKEKELAEINHRVFSLSTVMIPSLPEFAFISSSMVRELMHFGQDVKPYIAGDFQLNPKQRN
ncbi:MAG: pantetheine-phosphate adenylyltransferase [Muribaculaceae bacterium]|nr:pantetheine-phosphate adenylyltransferase [Muribaculaceae bacterium]